MTGQKVFTLHEQCTSISNEETKNSVAWKSAPSMFYGFGGSNFWRKTDKRKAIIKSHNRQKKRIVVGNQTGLSLLMFVANDDAK